MTATRKLAIERVIRGPPRIVILSGLVPWLGSRIIMIPFYLVVGSILYGSLLNAILVTLPFSLLFWIRPGQERLEFLGQRLKRSSRKIELFLLGNIPASLPAAAILIYLKNTPFEILAYLIALHVILWDMHASLLLQDKAGLVNRMVWLYPFGLILIVLLPGFSRFALSNSAITFVFGLAWLIFVGQYGAKDPLIEEKMAEYRTFVFDQRESIRTARAIAEDVAHNLKARPASNAIVIQDGDRLFSCTALLDGETSFAIIDCEMGQVVKPNKRVRSTLLCVDYIREHKRVTFSSVALFVFSPMISSFLGHHSKWAEESQHAYRLKFYKKFRPTSLLVHDMLDFWQSVRSYTKYCEECPSTFITERMVATLSAIRQRLIIRARQVQQGIEHESAISYLRNVDGFLAFIEGASLKYVQLS